MAAILEHFLTVFDVKFFFLKFWVRHQIEFPLLYKSHVDTKFLFLDGFELQITENVSYENPEKIHGNQNGVGATFSDCMWVGLLLFLKVSE